MLFAAALALALGWQVPCAPLRAASECRARAIGLQLPTERTGDTFLAVIDLGEGDGTVTHEFRPYFSSSSLITIRYPVPIVLQADPIQGVIKVTKSGDGLFEGDVRHLPGSHRRTAPLRSRRRAHTAVRTPPPSHAETRRPQVLRAFSTLEMRYDSAAKEVRSRGRPDWFMVYYSSCKDAPSVDAPSSDGSTLQVLKRTSLREARLGLSLGPSPGPGLSPSLTPTPNPSPDASPSHDPRLDPALTPP
jgi:hypothetical protein